jgi:hypothetical protein
VLTITAEVSQKDSALAMVHAHLEQIAADALLELEVIDLLKKEDIDGFKPSGNILDHPQIFDEAFPTCLLVQDILFGAGVHLHLVTVEVGNATSLCLTGFRRFAWRNHGFQHAKNSFVIGSLSETNRPTAMPRDSVRKRPLSVPPWWRQRCRAIRSNNGSKKQLFLLLSLIASCSEHPNNAGAFVAKQFKSAGLSTPCLIACSVAPSFRTRYLTRQPSRLANWFLTAKRIQRS